MPEVFWLDCFCGQLKKGKRKEKYKDFSFTLFPIDFFSHFYMSGHMHAYTHIDTRIKTQSTHTLLE